MIKFYSGLMRRHPFVTQCVSAGLLGSLGDAIAQIFVARREKFDYRECFRFFACGTFFGAPLIRTWYVVLNKLVPPGTKNLALKKMFLDQAIFTPPFVASGLGMLRLLDGQDAQGILASLERDYKKILFNNWKVWPFVQMVNFYFIPLNYQIIFVNCVAVVWNTYVAYIVEQKLDIKPILELTSNATNKN